MVRLRGRSISTEKECKKGRWLRLNPGNLNLKASMPGNNINKKETN